MAPKAAKQAAKKKAAKQKKVLIVLVLVLVVVLVLAFTTLLPSNSPAPVSAVPAASTTPAGSTAAPAPAASPGISPAPVGSLRAFSTLGRKDPFNDNGPHLSSAPPSTVKLSSGRLNHAVISINGKKFSVSLGAKFGHATAGTGAPLFRLAKVSETTAVVTVIGTKQNFTLHVRQPLTLAQKGAWKETLILEPVGTSATLTIKH